MGIGHAGITGRLERLEETRDKRRRERRRHGHAGITGCPLLYSLDQLPPLFYLIWFLLLKKTGHTLENIETEHAIAVGWR